MAEGEDEENLFVKIVTSPYTALAAILLGLLLGTYAPDTAGPFVDAFEAGTSALGASVAFIILFTITAALIDLYDLGGGKPPAIAIVLFVVSTIVAGLFATLVAWPLFQLPITGQSTGGVFGALSEVVGQLSTGEAMIAVLWAFGSAALMHGLRVLDRKGFGDPDGNLFERLLDKVLYVNRETINIFQFIGGPGVRYVGTLFEYVLPLILFTAGAALPTQIRQAQQDLPEGAGLDLSPAVIYVLTAVLIAVVSGIYLLAVAVFSTKLTGTSLRKALTKYLPPTYGFAWGTASSSLTIPINLEAAEEGLDARESTREFVIPLGATINLDGTMIGAMLITPMTMATLGLDLSLIQLLATFIPLVLVTVGAPGIPGGLSIIAPPILATILGLTGDIAQTFIGVWFALSFGLPDQFRTAANSTNNGFLCLILDWLFDKFGVERGVSEVAGIDTPDTDPEAAAEAA